MLLKNGEQMHSLLMGSLPVVISHILKLSAHDVDPSNFSSLTMTSLVPAFLLSPHLNWTYIVTTCILDS
jgi:hypothetical protein